MATNPLISLGVEGTKAGDILQNSRQRSTLTNLAVAKEQRAISTENRAISSEQRAVEKAGRDKTTADAALKDRQGEESAEIFQSDVIRIRQFSDNKEIGKIDQLVRGRMLDLGAQAADGNTSAAELLRFYKGIESQLTDPLSLAKTINDTEQRLVQLNEIEAAKTDKAASPTALTKLQSERARLEGLLASEQNPAQRKLIERSIQENQSGITKAIAPSLGTTEFDPAGQSAITRQQQGKDEVELREKKIGVEIFHSLAQEAKNTLTNTPDASTAVATLARFAVNISAEARALARNMDIDVSGVNFDPDKFTGDFGKLAGANREIKTMGLQLALALAVSAGQTNKALSDKDLARFIDQTGVDESDPRLIIQNLDLLDRQNQSNFKIRFQNIKEGQEFDGFSFEGQGDPTGIQNLSDDELLL